MAEPMKRMRPRGKGGVKLSGTTLDKSTGKRVFSREYGSGQAMAKAAGLVGAAKGTAQYKQLVKMTNRIRGIDAGRIKPELGERSFLRGVMNATGGAGGG